MDLTKESQQRKEFCDILFELAKSQESLQSAYDRCNVYKRLEALYDADVPDRRFRHFYMDIFSVLTQIQQNSDLGDINILGQNLDIIRNGYKPQNKTSDGKRVIDVSDAIKKLYDHVNLDIARIAYSDGADARISGESSLKDLQGQINSLQKELQKAQSIKKDYEDIEKKIVKVESELKNTQKEHIAILGIFAAVVLAFTGGIAFSTSVLNNIANASAYRIVAVSLIIGLILINILFGLFYYINLLVNENKKIFPLIISNAIIILLLFGTIIAWNAGVVENRNMKIENTQATSEKISDVQQEVGTIATPK